MATVTPTAAPSPNGRPTAPAGASLIRLSPLAEVERGMDWKRLMPAWVISGGIHVVMIALFVFFFWDNGSEAAPSQEDGALSARCPSQA
jgi:hypothetical protein